MDKNGYIYVGSLYLEFDDLIVCGYVFFSSSGLQERLGLPPHPAYGHLLLLSGQAFSRPPGKAPRAGEKAFGSTFRSP